MQAHIKSAVDLLQQAKSEHGPGLVYPCSFGLEGSVMIDLIHQNKLDISVLTLDTGRLPQATHDVIDAVRKHYDMDVRVLLPDHEEVEEMVTEHGENLFLDSVENRKLCCNVRKVKPLGRALEGCTAWITGRRREQSMHRSDLAMIEKDSVYKQTKYNPLIDWTWDQLWDYVRAHNVPYNALHDQHYHSIGCECCTRSITVGEDPRAGRWWWENDSLDECGLHVSRGEGESGEGI